MKTTFAVGLAIGNDTSEDDASSSEELFSAMEKIGVMYDRLKSCQPREADAICRTLPHLLVEFFPTQDVLNKVIGEMLSAQQLYPQHLAFVVFALFASLHGKAKSDTVHDWVLLSLPSFTQLEPLSLAVWSLTCFLVAASTNEWLRAM